MTPHEKAVTSVNARLERLQANLKDAKTETAQRFLFQSIVVTIGVAESLNGYITMVGQHAERRHEAVKQANTALTAQHADLLRAGQELLEKLKANPTDKALRKEIEGTQRNMESVQKNVRRGANALQRALAPGLAMIDEMAVSVRRFSEADQPEALKRMLKTTVGHVHALYAAQRALAGGESIDVTAWERTAGAEIDGALDFYDAFARAGFQVVLALEYMTLALAESPAETAEDARRRATEAASARVKEITSRFNAA